MVVPRESSGATHARIELRSARLASPQLEGLEECVGLWRQLARHSDFNSGEREQSICNGENRPAVTEGLRETFLQFSEHQARHVLQLGILCEFGATDTNSDFNPVYKRALLNPRDPESQQPRYGQEDRMS